MSGLTNVTYSDLANELVYQGQWFAGLWNTTNAGSNGTLHGTNDPTAAVSFIFPVPALEFYYFGMGRSRGGLYAICTDNCSSNSSFTPVDGFNATDNGQNPPVVLYHESFAIPGIHEIVLKNEVDQRGVPPGNSELCVVSFVLTIKLTDNGPTTSPFPSASSIPLKSSSSSSSFLFSQTASSATSSDISGTRPPPTGMTSSFHPATSTTAGSNSKERRAALPTSTTVGVALAGLVVCSACFVIGFMLVRWWRRHRALSARANASAYTSPMAYGMWRPITSRPVDIVKDPKVRLMCAEDSAKHVIQSGLLSLQKKEKLSSAPRVVPATLHLGRLRSGRRRNAVLRVAGQQIASIVETLPPEYKDVAH